MKKHRLATEVEVEKSSSRSLYQDVIALDKSDDSDSVALLDAVFDLLHLDVNEIDSAQSLSRHINNVDNSSSLPASKWALRWLLRRLSVKNDAAVLLGTDYRAWLLFNHLVHVLPFNVTNQMLKGHDILGIARRTLEKLSGDDWASWTGQLLANDQEAIQIQKTRSLLDIRTPGEPVQELSKSKKRKRNSTEHGLRPEPAPAKCFYYIVQGIKSLLTPPHGHNGISLRHWERSAILEANPKDTITILASGFETLSHIIEVTNATAEVDAQPAFDEDLCQPLIRLQEKAIQSAGSSHSTELAADALLECTMPTLRLLTLLHDASFSDSLKSQLDRQLRGYVAQTCIYPFRASCQNQSGKFNKGSEGDGEGQDEIFDAFGRMFARDSDNNSKDVEILFGIALECVRRENAAQKMKEDPWLQRLFALLVQHSPSLGQTESLIVAQVLLKIANDSALQIPAKQLTEILSSLAAEPESASWKTYQWKLIALCIENNPSLFTTRQHDSIPPITEAVFRQGASPQVDSSVQASAPILQQSASLADLVVGEVLVPIVKAFSKFREMETFLILWSQCLEQDASATPAAKSTLPTYTHDLLADNYWVDERVLITMTAEMKSSLVSARRLELLTNSVEALAEEAESIASTLQFVILADCIVSAADENETKLVKGSDLAEKMLRATWKWLTRDITRGGSLAQQHKLCKWRGWRLLSDMIAAGLLDTSVAEELKLNKTATKLAREGFDQDPDANLVDRASAWTCLFQNVIQADPMGEDESAKGFLQRVEKRIVKQKVKKFVQTHGRGYDFAARIDGPPALAQHCIASVLESGPTASWLEELLSEDIIDVVQHNAVREAISIPSSTLTSKPSGWQYLWFELNVIWQTCANPTLQHRVSAQHVRSFKAIQEPSTTNLRRFEIAIWTASQLRSDSLNNHDKQEVIDILGTWLDSDLWTVNEANDTLFQAHELLHRLYGAIGACERCQSRVSAFQSDQGQVDDLSLSQRLMLLEDMPNSDGEASLKASSIPKVVTAMITAAVGEEARAELLPKLKTTFWTAFTVLGNARSSLTFTIASKIVNKILEARQLPAVGQVQVDELFALVGFVASTHSQLDASAPGAIYTSLCNIFGTLLSDYRHRINGRYHLIVAGLKALLWCLFEPQQTGLHPRWVSEASTSISPTCAEQYSRLLQSLSDPSVSAARVGNKQSSLNDPTKKAKSIAGQHLSQLIVSFCSFQLQGRLDPSSRHKINHGLYAIMNAMSQDVMQHMNAAMNPSERAVFKGFYDDWKKFGRSRGA